MLGKGSSVNCCSTTAHDPPSQPLHDSEPNPWTVKQLLASASTEGRVKETWSSKGYLQKLWGTPMCVIPVQRTEGSWRACQRKSSVSCVRLPSPTAEGWRAESALLTTELVILHILSWATALQACLDAEKQMPKYASHQSALSSWYIQGSLSVISPVYVSGLYTTSELTLETLWDNSFLSVLPPFLN